VSDLEKRLAEFTALMLAKFNAPKVLAKQGATSVTIDGNIDRMDPEMVYAHYREEISERIGAFTREEKAGEDVDVANMAFLDWCCHRPAPKESSEEARP